MHPPLQSYLPPKRSGQRLAILSQSLPSDFTISAGYVRSSTSRSCATVPFTRYYHRCPRIFPGWPSRYHPTALSSSVGTCAATTHLDERGGGFDRLLWAEPLYGPCSVTVSDCLARGAHFEYQNSCHGGLDPTYFHWHLVLKTFSL
jgi:hypothetical protein